MKTIKVAEVVLDFDVYPRAQVDSQHAGGLAEALESGATLPPLILETKTNRCVDGFHRTRAYLSTFGPEHEIDVIEKKYKNERALFLDAVRYNAGHGRSLTRFDRTHCLLKAEKLEIDVGDIAGALSLTVDTTQKLRTERVGSLRNDTPIPLKRTIRHMAGQKLTTAQQNANRKLSGMNQLFYVNQVLLLLQNDLINLDAPLENGLRMLHAELDQFIKGGR